MGYGDDGKANEKESKRDARIVAAMEKDKVESRTNLATELYGDEPTTLVDMLKASRLLVPHQRQAQLSIIRNCLSMLNPFEANKICPWCRRDEPPFTKDEDGDWETIDTHDPKYHNKACEFIAALAASRSEEAPGQLNKLLQMLQAGSIEAAIEQLQSHFDKDCKLINKVVTHVNCTKHCGCPNPAGAPAAGSAERLGTAQAIVAKFEADMEGRQFSLRPTIQFVAELKAALAGTDTDVAKGE